MNLPGASRSADHLAPLDGLRGIAIALVLWFHVWQFTWLRADVHEPRRERPEVRGLRVEHDAMRH